MIRARNSEMLSLGSVTHPIRRSVLHVDVLSIFCHSRYCVRSDIKCYRPAARNRPSIWVYREVVAEAETLHLYVWHLNISWPAIDDHSTQVCVNLGPRMPGQNGCTRQTGATTTHQSHLHRREKCRTIWISLLSNVSHQENWKPMRLSGIWLPINYSFDFVSI